MLNIKGDELVDITLSDELKPNALLNLVLTSSRGLIETQLKMRLDTLSEIKYYKHGGVLSYLLKNII